MSDHRAPGILRWLTCALALLGTVGEARAAPISMPIGNASFEAPATGTVIQGANIAPWQSSGGWFGSAGVIHESSSSQTSC